MKEPFKRDSQEFRAASEACNTDDRGVVGVIPTTWGGKPAWQILMENLTGDLIINYIRPLP